MMMVIRFLDDIRTLSKKRGSLIIRIGAVVNKNLRCDKKRLLFPGRSDDTDRPQTEGGRMPRYKLTLEYDGIGYRGWQAQKNARSVQEASLQHQTLP